MVSPYPFFFFAVNLGIFAAIGGRTQVNSTIALGLCFFFSLLLPPVVFIRYVFIAFMHGLHLHSRSLNSLMTLSPLVLPVFEKASPVRPVRSFVVSRSLYFFFSLQLEFGKVHQSIVYVHV